MSNFSFRVSPFLTVLFAPRTTFKTLQERGVGFGNLAWWLALEYWLSYPVSVTRTILRARDAPVGGISALWQGYLRFALPPLFMVMAAAVAIYLVHRHRNSAVGNIHAVASTLAYAWVPHTLIVAVFSVLRAMDMVLSFSPLGVARQLPGAAKLLVWAVEYGLTAVLALIAIASLLSRPSIGKIASTRSPRAPVAFVYLVVAALMAGILGAGSYTSTKWHLARPIMVGEELPDFALVGLDGERLTRADLQGGVALVDFWATWCPPCVAAFPELIALQSRFPRSKSKFLLVSVNIEPHNTAAVRDFVSRYETPFPIFVDHGDFADRLSVNVYPTMFLVDRQMIVRRVYIGEQDISDLATEIEALLP